MLECSHQLWAPSFCQSALGSQNFLFGGLRWLKYVQIQLPAGAATATASTDPVPLSGIKESLFDRSSTNANQGWIDACASMIKIKRDNKHYSERYNISNETQKWKLKMKKNTCHSCWSEHNWSTNQSKNQSQSYQWLCKLNLKRELTSDWTNNWYWGKLWICHWKEKMKK